MKRGFLFTIVTLFMLVSLFVFSLSYLGRSSETQDIIVTLTGEKMAYLESDIGATYFDLLGVQFDKIERDSTAVNIKFAQVFDSIPSASDYDSLLGGYETFLEGTYSTLTNSVILLNNINHNFVIMPYGTTFVLIGNTLYIYTNSSGLLKNITIDTRLSVAENPPDTTFSTSLPLTDGPGYPKIQVTVRDSNGAAVLDNFMELNPNEVNNPFHVQLDYNIVNPPPSPWIDVQFGLINAQPGTLMLRTDGLNGYILSLNLGYTAGQKAYIQIGNADIDLKVGGLKKTGPVILASE